MGKLRSLPARRITAHLRRLAGVSMATAVSAVVVVAASPSAASADPFTYVDVSTGYHAACAVTNDGSAVCWGWNQAGSLGTADPSEKVATPSRVRLPDGQRFASVAAGEYFTTCGITTTGAVYCWGQHHLGSYFSPTSTTPVRTELPSGVRARSLANGGSIACAVSTADELWCWGDVLDFGNGSTEGTRTPERVPMPDGSGVQSVDVGPGAACAVTATQRLYCWGSNGDGEIGIGYVSTKVSTPAAVLLPAGVVPASVSVGLGRVCALDT
ncbi:MAG: RCC1 domain-containing protein, partial [Actinomycetota bacterium]